MTILDMKGNIVEDVEFPAIYIVHWPNKSASCCEEHAAQLKSLAEMMGFCVSVTRAPIRSQCDNCINESKNL